MSTNFGLPIDPFFLAISPDRRWIAWSPQGADRGILQSWPDLLHAWQLFYPEVPEAGQAWKQVESFLAAAEDSRL